MQVSISCITIPSAHPPGFAPKACFHLGAFVSKLLPGGRGFVGAAPKGGGGGICLKTMFAIFEVFIIMARIGDRQHFGIYLLL